MADGTIDVFVLHDETGQIVGIGHAPPGSIRTVEVRPTSDRGVLRLTLGEADLARLPELHLTHEVDAAGQCLRERKAGAS